MAVMGALVILGAVLTMLAIRSCWTVNRVGGGDNAEKPMVLSFATTVGFSKSDVLRAINPRGDNVIGVGARSIVYKGDLPEGENFALKMLLPTNDTVASTMTGDVDGLTSQRIGELVKEAEILAKLRHRNILKCLGFYSNLGSKALILEYMSAGSLHKHLQ